MLSVTVTDSNLGRETKRFLHALRIAGGGGHGSSALV